MMPPVPQNTSGLPTKLGSNSTAPATVGMPDWLPPSTMPRCTPSSTERGGSRPRGTSLRPGGAKHSTLVLKMGRAPRPVPMMSRLTPTIPVMAPPYGSSADGELWVSALKHSSVSGSNSMTPELSWNTERRKPSPGSTSRVVARMKWSNRERMVSTRPSSRYSMVALKILCLQCSDQVWASISSSTSVAASPSPASRRRRRTAGAR